MFIKNIKTFSYTFSFSTVAYFFMSRGQLHELSSTPCAELPAPSKSSVASCAGTIGKDNNEFDFLDPFMQAIVVLHLFGDGNGECMLGGICCVE